MLQNYYNYVEKKIMIIWSAFYISKLEKYYNITCLSSSHRKVKGTSFFLALIRLLVVYFRSTSVGCNHHSEPSGVHTMTTVKDLGT